MDGAHPEHPNLVVLDHPLIRQKLSRARERSTGSAEFRRLLNEIAGLMTFAASRHVATEAIEIETPLERTTGARLVRPVTLVPILRAGIGMTDGILALLPDARVGHLGVYRNEETLAPVSYYAKLPPDIAQSSVIIVDPMLATGGSAVFAVDHLARLGCSDIRMMCLVCAPEGVRRLHDAHPDVTVFAASLDRRLDETGYIRPGLGDAGDRLFGTQ